MLTVSTQRRRMIWRWNAGRMGTLCPPKAPNDMCPCGYRNYVQVRHGYSQEKAWGSAQVEVPTVSTKARMLRETLYWCRLLCSGDEDRSRKAHRNHSFVKLVPATPPHLRRLIVAALFARERAALTVFGVNKPRREGATGKVIHHPRHGFRP